MTIPDAGRTPTNEPAIPAPPTAPTEPIAVPFTGGKVIDDRFVEKPDDLIGKTFTVPADPWEHRSARMSCQTCMWFNAKKPRTDFGRCRKHAPELGGWPAVYGRDWCGDHKLDEKHA